LTISPLANRFLAVAAEDSRSNWQETADLIKRAGRFVLSPEVVKLTLRVPEPDKLLPAVIRGIQLPHDPCWIEYSPAEVFAGRSEVARHFGLLFWRDSAGEVCNRLVVRNRVGDMIPPGDVVRDPDAMMVLLYPCDLVFRPSGAVVRATQTGVSADSMADFRVAAENLGWLGLMFVLLLTAKNAPLLVGESEDLARLNKQRVRSGKPPLVNARPVQWNLSREERRAVRASVPFDRNARTAAMTHMVRGHMKVRKSGVFWWSSHFRNAEDGELETGRDYVVH
jgi:hypothetical protein